MITESKWAQLKKRMTALAIKESDIIEKFVIGSGSGGQKLHKTSSCVSIKHIPTGVQVKCQQSRFRDDNRFFARRRLCEKLDKLLHDRQSAHQNAVEKIRRQKKKRSKRAKAKMLDQKNQRSVQKKLRNKPDAEDDRRSHYER